MADLEYVYDTDLVAARDTRESILGQIGNEIERLAVTVDQLGQRLQPVMSPLATVDGLAPVPQPAQSAIRDHRDGLSTQIGRLQRILDQLEV